MTGGTGFLGHYLLAELLRAGGIRCRVLLRPPLSASRARLGGLLAELDIDLERRISCGEVSLVEGELPGPIDLAPLEGVQQVIHAAASTSFNADPDGDPMRTNVDGTRRVLDLASALGIRDFVFVSSAFVCGKGRGIARETVDDLEPEFTNDYERSKWQAEQLVWSWATNDRSATICRPSILIGDRATGRSTHFGGIYVPARAVSVLARGVDDDPDANRHRVPLRIPGRPSATINVVPVCWAAKSIARIALQRPASNRVFHLTNPEPPTHAEFKSWLESFYDIAGGSFTDQTWPWPNPTPYEEAFHQVGGPVLGYFRHDLEFESRAADAAPNGRRLVDRAHFTRCLTYAECTHWGRRRRSAVSPRRETDVDLDWYFSTFMPARLPRSGVARIHALTTTVRFAIEGEDDEQWVCRFERGQLVDQRKGRGGPTGVFGYRIRRSGFQDIVTGRQTVQSIFYRGDADLVGNTLQAMKMAPIIEAFIREFPVRPRDLVDAT